jgi:hypothetical protein
MASGARLPHGSCDSIVTCASERPGLAGFRRGGPERRVFPVSHQVYNSGLIVRAIVTTMSHRSRVKTKGLLSRGEATVKVQRIGPKVFEDA